MTNPNLVNALKSYANNPTSVVEGALLVSNIIDPDSDSQWCRKQLQEIAAGMASDSGAAGLVTALGELGFTGASEYYQSANSNLQHVLRERKGIPISLAAMVIGVAEQLGLQAHGVNFPGHFIVAVDKVLIDPFTMTLVDETESHRWLRKQGFDPKTAFSVATPQLFVVRMLNNLTGLARASDNLPRALELADYKLAVTPERLPIYLERAELWIAVGVNDMARRDLESALELVTDANSRRSIEQRLGDLEDTPTRLH
ncbi:transglutaminase family protein [Candidatus Litorirhabdus singularis]|nr:transglutaminase family protein [Candidatus Litorirhabdus singularis]